MVSPENPNWIFDCTLIDEISVSGGDFAAQGNAGFYWQTPGFNGSSNASLEANGLADVNGPAESGSRKRARQDSLALPGSKACREKMRRDKLNDKFMELAAVLEPGKPTNKIDKAAILNDTVRMVTQLRSDAQKLKDSNESLQEKVKELKSEKIELRDEKLRLKAEKESLEQQVKALSMPPSFLHPPMMPNAFMAPAQAAAGNKMMMPFMGYPGFMYQFQSLPVSSDDKNELPPAA